MLFKNRIKKKATKDFYKALIKSESLCFDIGANLGYKSNTLLSLKHKVIAFEPQKNCQSSLIKMKEQHPNFKVKQLAIGAEAGELDLFIGNHIEIATLSDKFRDYFKSDTTYWNSKERVKVVTLNSQIEAYGLPFFCKIDTEGLEYEILKNLTHKIPVIEFEFTGGFIEETLLSISKINDLGNYCFNYILNEKPKFEAEDWISADTLKQIITSMPIKNLHGNIFAKLKP